MCPEKREPEVQSLKGKRSDTQRNVNHQKNESKSRESGELFGKDLCTVYASVSCFLRLHKQPVVWLAVEVASTLYHTIILPN